MGNLILLIGAGLVLLCFLPPLVIAFGDIADMRRNSKRSQQIQEECNNIINQLG